MTKGSIRSLRDMIDQARGLAPADLALRGGKVDLY